MDLNTFLPIAKKFGLIINKRNDGGVEFYIDKHKYNTPYNGWVCTYFKKSNEMGSPRMKVLKLRNDESAFDLHCGSDINLRNDLIFEKPKYVEKALTEMFKRLEKFKRR
jgi:hypothetical protein